MTASERLQNILPHKDSLSAGRIRNHYHELPRLELDSQKKEVRELRRKGFKHVSDKHIFVGYLVLSKDYGIYTNRRKNWRKSKLFPKNKDLEYIWTRNLYLFSSTDKYIRSNLESIGLTYYSQSTIEDFTENNDKSKKP